MENQSKGHQFPNIVQPDQKLRKVPLKLPPRTNTARFHKQTVATSQNDGSIPSHNIRGQTQLNTGYPDEQKIFCLTELVEKYSHLLPLRVKVMSGFMAESEGDPTIYIDEVYNIHAVKESEVALISNSRRQTYRFPLYSAAKFSVIGKFSQKQCDANDLFNADTLPPFVSVVQNYVGHTPEFSFTRNEVLVLGNILKESVDFHLPAIEVFSVTCSKQKYLPQDYNVILSTDPSDTQVYLSEIIQHASHLLPCRAQIFLPQEMPKLSKHISLAQTPVTIEKKETQTSLLISLHCDENKSYKEEYPVIDIPVSIDIDVQVLPQSHDHEDYTSLQEKTYTLVSEYDPTKLQACVNANDDDVYVTQAELLKLLRTGFEAEGTKIKTSGIERDGNIYQPLILPANVTSDDSTYALVNQTSSDSVIPKPIKYTSQKEKSYQSETSGNLKDTSASLAESHSDQKGIRQRQEPRIPQVISTTKPLTESKKSQNSPIVSRPPPLDMSIQKTINLPTNVQKPLFVFPTPVVQSTLEKTNESERVKKPPIALPRSAVLLSPKTTNVSERLQKQAIASPPPAGFLTPQIMNESERSQKPMIVVASKNKDIGQTHHTSNYDEQSTGAIKSNKTAIPQILVESKQDSSTGIEKPDCTVSLERSDSTLLAINDSLRMLIDKVDKIERRQLMLERDVLQTKLQGADEEGTIKSTHTHSTIESMTQNDIRKLLEAMDMPQYIEAFSREQVDGGLLMEVDDHTLQVELGVSFKLHRIKLMRIINGVDSPQKYSL